MSGDRGSPDPAALIEEARSVSPADYGCDQDSPRLILGLADALESVLAENERLRGALSAMEDAWDMAQGGGDVRDDYSAALVAEEETSE
jgi:hypothetical protein